MQNLTQHDIRNRLHKLGLPRNLFDKNFHLYCRDATKSWNELCDVNGWEKEDCVLPVPYAWRVISHVNKLYDMVAQHESPIRRRGQQALERRLYYEKKARKGQ